MDYARQLLSESWFQSVAGSVLAAVLIAGASLLWRRYRASRGRKRVTICLFDDLLIYLPVYVAQQRGFFARQGLKVDLIRGGGDRSTWAKVVSREADFGIADPIVMILDSDTKGVVVASILSRVALWGVSRKRILPIKTPEHFAGLRVAVFEPPSTSFSLLGRILAEAGDEVAKTVEVVQMQPGTEMGHAKSPEVDVTILTEPVATSLILEGAHEVFSGPRFFGEFLNTGCFAREDYVKANSKVTQAVVNALEDALRYIQENTPGTLEVATGVFKSFDARCVEMATMRLIAEEAFPRHALVLEAAWRRCLEAWSHDLPQESAVYSYRDTVRNDFAQSAELSRKAR